jgi:hypothetical protein
MVESPSLSLVFSFTISDAQNVSLIVSGQDSTPMHSASLTQWEATLSRSPASYPFDVSYNYVKDGVQCFPLEQLVTVLRRPLNSVIVVKDEFPLPSCRDFGLRIRFHLFPHKPDGHPFLFLPHFIAATPMQLLRVRNSTALAVDAIFRSTLIHALAYKYGIAAGHNHESVKMESGHAHLLRVNHCLPGTTISVFDVWADPIEGFPYYPRVVEPNRWGGSNPQLMIEYQPHKMYRNVFLNCEPMVHEGEWMIRKAVPPKEFPISIKIGVIKGKNSRKIKDKSVPDWAIPLSEKYPPSILSGRFLFGARRKYFAVYVPLVSLRTDDAAEVGDFATIAPLAEWAKKCGIEQIHLHIETLPGHLLDPIHASIDYAHPGLDLTAIRDAKLSALHEVFRNRRDVSQFKMFLKSSDWIKDACASEFERWVQFVLFNELDVAVNRSIDLGIQLITDFIVCGSLPTNTCPLMTIANFFHGIRLCGLELYARFPTPAFIEELFRGFSQRVFQDFFRMKDGVALYRPEVPIESVLGDEGRDVREAIGHNLNFIASLPHPNESSCKEYLSDLSSTLPCAIILDSAATTIFGSKYIISTLKMIPSSSSPIVHGCAMPRYLSPEMISEFPSEETKECVLKVVRDRARSEAMGATVYLQDLRFMLSGTHERPITALQQIIGHCRFMAPFTVVDLDLDADLNSQIGGFLQENLRRA